MDTCEQNQKFHSLLTSKSLQSILDVGRELYPHPMILCDLTHRLLAATKEPDLNHAPWNEILSIGRIPLDLANQKSASLCYRCSMESETAQIEDSRNGAPMMLRRALCSDSKIIGYLDSPCYRDEPFREEERELFDLIADLCALRMEKDHNYAESPKNMLEFFISDLMEGRIVNERLIEARLKNFNWNLEIPFYIMTLHYNCKEEWPSNLTLQAVCQRLSASVPFSKAFVYGRNIKMIIPPAAAAIIDIQKRKKLLSILKRECLSAGISRPCRQFSNFSEFNHQSEKALSLGLLLRKENCIYFYDDFAVFHVLELCSESFDLMKLCHSAIYTLAEYDSKKKKNLVATLEAYFNCQMRIPEAAEMLSIHRNTMIYRINKINELLNINLHNSETVFHLLFSYHILEYYSATVMKDQDEQRRRKPVKKE